MARDQHRHLERLLVVQARIDARAVRALEIDLRQPARAADDDAPKGPAVTVLKVAKSCFSDIVEATGTIIAREETSVRPERPGLKVTDVLAEAGDTTTAGQVLARLALPEGGTLQVTAPVAGVIATSTAQIGNLAVALRQLVESKAEPTVEFNSELGRTAAAVQRLLGGLDPGMRTLIEPLLMNPIRGSQVVVNDAGNDALGESWA